jgi:hypothetical protein
MFDHHRKSPWFAEKYDPAPEFQALRARVRKEGWKGRLDSFLLDLEAGKFDPDFTEPESEPSSPVKDSIANVENAMMDTNGTTILAAEEPKAAGGDEEMQFNVDVEEEGGDNDANRTEMNGKSSYDHRRPHRGEEIAVPAEGNQVMIRTIPPDIGRVKLEEVNIQSICVGVLLMMRI